MPSSRIYIKQHNGPWTLATEGDFAKLLQSKYHVIQLSDNRGYTLAMDLRVPLSHYDSGDVEFLKSLNVKIEQFLKSYFHTFDTGIKEPPPILD
jgi:hypothetical protein